MPAFVVTLALADNLGVPANLFRADRVMVMKNGHQVGTRRTSEATKDQVLGMIILGRLPEEGTEEDLKGFR